MSKHETPQEQIGRLQYEMDEMRKDIAAFERVTRVLNKQLKELR